MFHYVNLLNSKEKNTTVMKYIVQLYLCFDYTVKPLDQCISLDRMKVYSHYIFCHDISSK